MTALFKRELGFLYFLVGDTASSSRVAYLLASNTLNPPNEISLNDSWNTYLGCYIFLNLVVNDKTEFASVITSYLADIQCTDTRFCWIEDPNNTASGLDGNFLKISQTGNVTKEVKVFNFNNLSFLISKNCSVIFNKDKNWFEITPTFNNYKSNYLLVKQGSKRLLVINSLLRLPLTGDQAGCWQFNVTLSESDLDDLDIGLRFFIDDRDYAGFNYLDSQRYPIFSLGGKTINLLASLDPLGYLDENRTYFAFSDSASNLLLNNADIGSYFRTRLGQQVKLVAQADAKVVFAIKPSGQQVDINDPVYLTPSGSFAINVPAENNNPVNPSEPYSRMLCGISGVEYFGLMLSSGNLLKFFPDQNAYAFTYKPVDVLDQDDTFFTPDASLLTNLATTSWVYVTPPAGNIINYYAQPDDSVLYQTDTTQQEFLGYLEVSAGTLPQTVVMETVKDETNNSKQVPEVFPLVPYSGIKTTSLVDYYQLELQVLSPTRRKVIYDLVEWAKSPNPPPPESTEHSAVTPQGLLATFDGSLQYWKRLTLAQSSQGTKLFQLGDITHEFKAALQTNQLFLVISSAERFLHTCSVLSSELNIHDWNFNLDPSQWQQHNTIAILKFHDKSLKELVNNLATWTHSFHFNSVPTNIQETLKDIINKAIEKNKTESALDYFAQTIVNEHTWNGILLLNTPVELPSQIEGLAAGLDPSQFYCHHFGINVNPITYDESAVNNKLIVHDSSLFGLIDYEDDQNLTDFGTDYQFKVKTLKVLFQNSDIASFSSQIEIMANKFFGEPVTLEGSTTGNNLLLTGTLQKHDGHDSYLFIKQGDDIFKFNSHVLDELEILKAQFITIVPTNSLNPGDKIHSRFIFWGNMKYFQLPGFDLFSFGSSYDEQGKETFSGGLTFANLIVDMAFDPTKALDKVFSFDATQMAFDLSQSVARPKSFFNHFPIKLKTLYQANEQISPANLDYISLDAPLGQSELSFPWFGLVFELNLGGMGALVGQGSFSANLLAAWAPNDSGSSVFIGLKLPGMSNGKKELSLQGILKLAINNIGFTVNDTNYLLRLNDIGLKFFSLSFPRYGQTNILLFGDADGKDRDTLAWYAAYVNKK